MNRLFFILPLLFIFIMPQAWGSTSPYPSPYRQTMWNNFTDGIHTLGQSPRQANFTKIKLHNKRTQARIRSINQAKRNAWLNSN
jgi:hypothetical protein